MTRVVVHHFGPDPETVGGMASVIRVLTEHSVGADVVDSHPTWRPHSSAGGATLLAASAARVLLQMPPSEIAHVHLSERGAFLREGALVALASRRGITTVVTIHGASFIPFARQHPRLVAAVLGRAQVITCLEQEALDVVRRAAPRTRSEIVPNPVLVEGDVLPADATDELIVFAGEVGLRKGADVLQRAWQLVMKRRPQARCVMVGPVSDFTPPETERLEVRPAIDPLELTALLRRARAVALPSRAEGMPMVLTEAMSLGRPFVSTPVGAIPELAAAGGVLVAVEDEIELADRLTELLANPGLAREIGDRGRRFCMETRGVEVVDALLRNLYTAASAASRDR